jgi:hypothetical protein
MTAVQPRLSVVTGLGTVFDKRCSNGPIVHQVHLRSVVVGFKVGPVGDSRPRSFDVRRSTLTTSLALNGQNSTSADGINKSLSKSIIQYHR